MLFPEILEDETLYSLVARLSILNDYSPSNLPIYSDPTQPVRAADLIVSLESFTINTNRVYGDATSLARRFNLNKKNQYINVENCLIAYSNPVRNIWKWCENCREEELTNIGISYWHKLLQHECTFICIKHKTPLRIINLPFRNRQNRFFLPTDTKHMENSSACDDGCFDIAFHISSIQESLVKDDFVGNPDTLQQLFAHRQNSSQWEPLLGRVIQLLAKDKQRTCSFMKSLLTSQTPPENYLPVLIHLVFGDYEFFKLNYKWALVFGNVSPKAKAFPEPNKMDHRRVLLSFMNNTHEPTRTDLWKLYPKTARWLNKYDVKWLNKHIPKLEKKYPHQQDFFA